MRPQLALVALVTLSLAACGPATGTGDSAATLDAADVLEAGPDAQEPRDTVTVDEAPALEASTPDARSDAPPADVLTCATDMDRDGFVAASCGGNDCDDTNARVHPGQGPHCDATLTDSDCNGTPDTGEQERRNGRCDLECRALMGRDCAATSTVLCTADEREPSCRACTGSGAAERCVCWRSGETSTRSCTR